MPDVALEPTELAQEARPKSGGRAHRPLASVGLRRRRRRRSCPAARSSRRSSRVAMPFSGVWRTSAGRSPRVWRMRTRGIVHRDIKPSNLLLDTEGVVWITDFGLAKGDDEGLTLSGDILGTIRYMAPERFRGEGDARADVYAPWADALRAAHAAPVSARVTGLPDRADQDGGARAAAGHRFPDPAGPGDDRAQGDREGPESAVSSAEAMAEDLRRFVADEPIRARQVSAPERYWRWARRKRGSRSWADA